MADHEEEETETSDSFHSMSEDDDDDDEVEEEEDSDEATPLTESETDNEVTNPVEADVAKIGGCSHYVHKVDIIAPCCSHQYSCRLCHNETEDHEVDRFAVTEIVCRDCSTRQEVANQCSNCGTAFGSYCCLKCRLWDFIDKKQWHCEGCGICRVGGKDNFFHCDLCGYCLANELKDSHRCIPGASRNVCAICLDSLHDSRVPLQLFKCGHPVHKTCWKKMMQLRVYTCPTCKQSVVETQWGEVDNMVAEHLAENPIPEEFVKDVDIICNDCHKRATVKDYLIGLYKCPNTECGSYNTQR